MDTFVSGDAVRQCRYCEASFQASSYRPQQQVCSSVSCQKRRRADYHRQKRHTDAVYAEVCRDSQKKWREANSNYQKQYWQDHPEAARHNRDTQPQRDQRRRLRHLVKNNVALDLTRAGATVYLVGPAAAQDLVKNTLAQSKLLIFQSVSAPAGLLVKNTQLDQTGRLTV